MTIYRNDGSAVSFSVSSEFDRDEEFFEAVSKRIPDDSSNREASDS